MGTEFKITEDIVNEEENISKENNEEAEKCIAEYYEKYNEQELSEQRYKRLMHLLDKSQFYSQFLLQKIEQSQTSATSGKGNSKNGLKVSVEKDNSVLPPRKRRKKREVASGSTSQKSNVESESSNNDGSSTLEPQPEFLENISLRPYQLEGFSWLKTLYENGINGILADEMGLGKTVQTISLLCHLVRMGIQGPFLVVAPLSTLPNWLLEFRRFAPKLPVILYHGNATVRKEARQKIATRSNVSSGTASQPIVVTSYEVAIRDCKFLRAHVWQYLIVDEGHRLKNHKCILGKALNSLTTTNRVILTGTPLQNNLAELWSLLNFLMPEIFDSLDVFESWFQIDDMLEEGADRRIVEQERSKQIVSTLHKILSPFLLRRVKDELDLGIPAKRELIVYAPMTEFQLGLYRATLKKDEAALRRICGNDEDENNKSKSENGKRQRHQLKNLSVLLSSENSMGGLMAYAEEASKEFPAKSRPQNGEKSAKKMEKWWTSFNMRNLAMQLRKIVNHPYLLCYPLDENGEYKVDDDILKLCGKLQVVDQLLVQLHKRGHRVLLFSQMTKVLDILEDYLTLRPQFKYKRLDGNVSLDDRAVDIKEFNETGDDFLYLLSTRAGGLGVNLASADTVIIYDSDWNPQQDLQAQDRCHRLGQEKPVCVLRLVTASTIDERMVERATAKRKIEKVVMKKGHFKTKAPRNDAYSAEPEELLQLLRSSDHYRTHRASSGTAIFTKQEIEQILDRSSWESGVDNNGNLVQGVFKVIS